MVRQLSDALEWPLVFCLCVALGACSAKLPHTKQSESTPVELAEEWFACTVDADCKVILDATYTFVSINVAHEADVQNWIERELARTILGDVADGNSITKRSAVSTGARQVGLLNKSQFRTIFSFWVAVGSWWLFHAAIQAAAYLISDREFSRSERFEIRVADQRSPLPDLWVSRYRAGRIL